MPPSLTSTVRHLRILAAPRGERDLPDADLLARFRDHADEAAFALLVQRHGPMVLGVCRRVLGNWHDAEDAFQATFLVLARSADVIRKQSSLASWLYGVAQRTAGKARKREAGFQARRHRAATWGDHETADPTEGLARQDLRAVLDEELSQLPEHYRAPIVLCYLEGKLAEVAAQELGIPRGTLSSRLAKGRELLRDRLQQRGVTASGGLLAGVLAREACAVSASLTLAAVRAASAKLGSTALVGTGRLKTVAAMLLLAAGLLGGVVSAHRPPVAAVAAAVRDEGESVEVRGRVLGVDGKPFAGAKLYLGWNDYHKPAYTERATSGADGTFAFRFDRTESDKSAAEKPEARVVAVAAGHGCDWATVGVAGGDMTLRLVKDVPIEGRLVDLEGTAVVGAKVTVYVVWAMKDEVLGPYLEAAGKTGGVPADSRHLFGPLPGQPAALTTGRDGRFRFAGAGRERVVTFDVQGRDIASTSLLAMTRPSEPVQTRSWHNFVYGSTFTFACQPTKPLRGVVRDRATGKPIAGVFVGRPGNSWFVTTTNEEGKFELRGFAKQPKYGLVAMPADGRYLQRRVEFADTPGFDPVTCDIELVRGLTVRGKVIDKETGKPVAGATVDYHPLGGNQFVDKLFTVSWDPRAETTTDTQGSYSITVLPGPGVIGVKARRLAAYLPAASPLKERNAFFKTRLVDNKDEETLTRYAGGGSYGGIGPDDYNALVLLEPDEKEKVLVRDVTLERPQERKGTIVGPDDRPISGVTVYGLARFGIDLLEGSEFTVRGINPKAKRPLVFYHKEKKLGFYLKDLRDEKPGPLAVKLQPCGSASGRVVDGDGRAVAGVTLYVWGQALRIIGEAGGGWHSVETDKEGRFRVEGLVPGQDYAVQEWGDRPSLPRVHGTAVVKPGGHSDVGDLKRGERRE